MGEYNGFVLADDYAHHPTELKATLSAAKKLKKSLSSFDELEVISINGVSNAQDADEVIDLTGSIADALKDYETEWNKAFENAESKASQFAESLTKIFAEANAVEGFSRIVDSVKEFSDVVTPFTQGFGDGFVNFFGELSEITLDAFTTSLDFLGDILEDVDPETLEKAKQSSILIGQSSEEKYEVKQNISYCIENMNLNINEEYVRQKTNEFIKGPIVKKIKRKLFIDSLALQITNDSFIESYVNNEVTLDKLKTSYLKYR